MIIDIRRPQAPISFYPPIHDFHILFLFCIMICNFFSLQIEFQTSSNPRWLFTPYFLMASFFHQKSHSNSASIIILDAGMSVNLSDSVHFGSQTVFSRGFRKFIRILWLRSRYLKGLPGIPLWYSEKIITEWHANQTICQENEKSYDFKKPKHKIIKNEIEIFWEKTPFVRQTFLKRL